MATLWPYLATMGLLAALSWFAWRWRSVPGVRPFVVACLASFLWAGGSAAALAAADPSAKLAWYKFLLLLHDVTEQRRAQAQILEQQGALATLQERERLARELHDGAGQVLGYVSLQTQAIVKWWPTTPSVSARRRCPPMGRSTSGWPLWPSAWPRSKATWRSSPSRAPARGSYSMRR